MPLISSAVPCSIASFPFSSSPPSCPPRPPLSCLTSVWIPLKRSLSISHQNKCLPSSVNCIWELRKNPLHQKTLDAVDVNARTAVKGRGCRLSGEVGPFSHSVQATKPYVTPNGIKARSGENDLSRSLLVIWAISGFQGRPAPQSEVCCYKYVHPWSNGGA